MADANTELKQIAIQVANELKGRALALEPERLKLEARLAEIKLISDNGRLVHQRARNFIPLIGADYQCPSCWMHGERKSGLRPVDNPNGQDDIFACRECGAEFAFPA